MKIHYSKDELPRDREEVILLSESHDRFVIGYRKVYQSAHIGSIVVRTINTWEVQSGFSEIQSYPVEHFPIWISKQDVLEQIQMVALRNMLEIKQCFNITSDTEFDLLDIE